ncbi:MAG: hypothetical protein AAF799_05395 [Myxococcota bacterium]
MSARSRFGRAALALAVVAGLGACKRSKAPLVEEVWDEAPASGQAEALGSLAPPWSAPTRAVLDSGLITFWLHEPDAPATHLRVLLPVGDRPELQSAAVVAVLETHLQQSLATRARSQGISVETRSAPDRIEIVLHSATADTSRALSTLGRVLAARSPSSGLETARAEVAGRLEGEPTADERATAALAATLLGRRSSAQQATAKAVTELSRDALLEGWEQLVDPRRAVLVVHSGHEASLYRAALRKLADGWRGRGRRPVLDSAIARLRTASEPSSAPGRLLAEPATPMHIVPGPEGSPVVMIGRVVPTRSAADRSLARLAQRVLQEELDARLVIRGDHGLFMLRVPLSGREPEQTVTEAIDALTSLATTRQPQQRLFQAAQLWLGARMVQASLDGEDWTASWSDAIDLAEDDDAIVGALARDARSMLEPDPEALQQWLRQWLDPRSSEPGWRWLVAGASDRQTRRLARITPLAGADGESLAP